MWDYDVAISFAGEDRETAYELANLLYSKYGHKVFYDDFEQAKLLGKNLTEYLMDIYKNKCRYCIVIISESYKEKRWTKHEWRSAQARAFEEPETDYILPIRIDDTEIPGLLPTVGYLPLSSLGIDRVVEVISQKINESSDKHSVIATSRSLYDKADYNKALNLVGDKLFDDDIEALRIRADCYAHLSQYSNAIDSLDKIIMTRPKDFLSHFLLGIFCYRSQRFKRSVKHYSIAAKMSPDHPTIKVGLPAAKTFFYLSYIPGMNWALKRILKN